MLGSGQLRAFVFDIGPMTKYDNACMLRQASRSELRQAKRQLIHFRFRAL